MKKIAVIGSHGVGKSSLCSQLCQYCEDIPRYAYKVSEIVRECPFPIHEKQTLETTLWIVTKQMNTELDGISTGPDFLICDRSVLDPLVYFMYQHPNDVPNLLIDFVNDYFKSYDQIYLIKPSGGQIEGDGFRSTDKMFQMSIHSLFMAWTCGKADLINQNEIFGPNVKDLCKRIIEGTYEE